MHALAAAEHGASAGGFGGGGGFGVVLFGGAGGLSVVVVFVVVLVDVEDDGAAVLLDGGADTAVCGFVVVTVGVSETVVAFCWPAARPMFCGCCDEQALSTAMAAIAAPMTSLRTCIPVSLSRVIPCATRDGPL